MSDHSRGFYISFSLEIHKLSEILIDNKRKTKDKNLKELKKEALERAKQRINNP